MDGIFELLFINGNAVDGNFAKSFNILLEEVAAETSELFRSVAHIVFILRLCEIFFEHGILCENLLQLL